MNTKKFNIIINNFWVSDPIMTINDSGIMPEFYIAFNKRPISKYKIRFVPAERQVFSAEYTCIYLTMLGFSVYLYPAQIAKLLHRCIYPLMVERLDYSFYEKTLVEIHIELAKKSS